MEPCTRADYAAGVIAWLAITAAVAFDAWGLASWLVFVGLVVILIGGRR